MLLTKTLPQAALTSFNQALSQQLDRKLGQDQKHLLHKTDEISQLLNHIHQSSLPLRRYLPLLPVYQYMMNNGLVQANRSIQGLANSLNYLNAEVRDIHQTLKDLSKRNQGGYHFDFSTRIDKSSSETSTLSFSLLNDIHVEMKDINLTLKELLPQSQRSDYSEVIANTMVNASATLTFSNTLINDINMEMKDIHLTLKELLTCNQENSSHNVSATTASSSSEITVSSPENPAQAEEEEKPQDKFEVFLKQYFDIDADSVEGKIIIKIKDYTVEAVDKAKNYEDDYVAVSNKIHFNNPQESAQLKKDILSLSAQTKASVQEITQITGQTYQAGVNSQDLIPTVQTALKVATVFDLATQDAASMVASWKTQMGLSQSQSEQLADTVTFLSNTMRVDGQALLKTISEQGKLAKEVGVDETALASLSSSLLASGATGEQSGAAIEQIFTTLHAGQNLTQEKQQQLQTLGFDPVTLASQLQTNTQGTLTQLLASLNQQPKEQQQQSIATLFGQDNVATISRLVAQPSQLNQAFTSTVDNSQYQGELEQKHHALQSTTSARLELLTSKLERLQLVLGDSLLQTFGALCEPIFAVIDGVSNLIEKFPVLTGSILTVGTTLFAAKKLYDNYKKIGSIFNTGKSTGTGNQAGARIDPTLLRDLGKLNGRLRSLGATSNRLNSRVHRLNLSSRRLTTALSGTNRQTRRATTALRRLNRELAKTSALAGRGAGFNRDGGFNKGGGKKNKHKGKQNNHSKKNKQIQQPINTTGSSKGNPSHEQYRKAPKVDFDKSVQVNHGTSHKSHSGNKGATTVKPKKTSTKKSRGKFGALATLGALMLPMSFSGDSYDEHDQDGELFTPSDSQMNSSVAMDLAESGLYAADALNPQMKGLSKIAKPLGKIVRPLGMITSAFSLADAIMDEDSENRGARIGEAAGDIGGGLAGAAMGAAIGSIIPGIGTAIGGLIGGVIGSFSGGWAGEKVGALLDEVNISEKIPPLTTSSDETTKHDVVKSDEVPKDDIHQGDKLQKEADTSENKSTTALNSSLMLVSLSDESINKLSLAIKSSCSVDSKEQGEKTNEVSNELNQNDSLVAKLKTGIKGKALSAAINKPSDFDKFQEGSVASILELNKPLRGVNFLGHKGTAESIKELMDAVLEDNKVNKGAKIGKAVGGLIGGFYGGRAGGSLGTLLGSSFPIVGTSAGFALGSLGGGYLGTQAGSWVGEKVGSLFDTENLGAKLFSSLFFWGPELLFKGIKNNNLSEKHEEKPATDLIDHINEHKLDSDKIEDAHVTSAQNQVQQNKQMSFNPVINIYTQMPDNQSATQELVDQIIERLRSELMPTLESSTLDIRTQSSLFDV